MVNDGLEAFGTFGGLLRHLRRQAQLTQQQLGLAVGYSSTMITRLENGDRLPDLATVKTLFVEALSLSPQSATAKRLVALAEKSRDLACAADMTFSSHQSVPKTNLPILLTPTVGREQELDAVCRILRSTRLVTFTGTGGVGKTRLAVEVGRHLLSRFPDGIWLVELAQVMDPALVPQVVAEVFGVKERSGQSATLALTAYLADKQPLVVLDNCEHLVTACATLAEQVLGGCPGVRILATSREALRVPGEVVWRVPSLTLPEPAARPSAAQLLECASAQLFVQQAAAAQPGFTLTDANAPAVAHICRRLDGIPLAIEMAAACLPGMTVDEMTTQLDQRFHLLTSGRRTALPRQQTLHAALEWSYQLLSELERLMLERLSIFTDGCMADAATAVCAGGSISDVDVLPLLLALVDKSLLVADQRVYGTRYRMLETVRVYAAERLQARDATESDCLRGRHVAFLIELSDRWRRDGLIGADKTNFILRLEAELGNARALLGWARGRPDDGVLSLELAAALWTSWHSGGFLSEGQTWLEDALARARAAPVKTPVLTLAQGRALNQLAHILHARGEHARLESVARECLEIAEHANDADLVVSSLMYLGIVAQSRLDFNRAMADLTRGIAMAHDAGLLGATYNLLIILATVQLQRGERPQAAICLQEYVAQSQQLDILPGVAEGRRYLSIIDLAQALRDCVEDVAHYRAISHARGLAMSLLTLGHLLVADGQHERAGKVLVESHAIWRRIGLLRPGGNGGAPLAAFELARLTWLQGDVELARQRYGEYRETTERAGDNAGVSQACLWMGYLALGEGDMATAARDFRDCLALRQEPWNQALVLAALARLVEQQGDRERAARLFGTASTWEALVQASLTATDRLVFDRDMSAARAHLANTEWADAWAEGERISLEQAVAAALAAGA